MNRWERFAWAAGLAIGYYHGSRDPMTLTALEGLALCAAMFLVVSAINRLHRWVSRLPARRFRGR